METRRVVDRPDPRAIASLMRCAIVILSFVLSSGSVVAQDNLRLANGCTAEATVHENSCVVASIISFTGDSWQSGSQRRGTLVSIIHYDRDRSVTKWETEGTRATLDFKTEILVSMVGDLMIEGNWLRAVNDTGWQSFDTATRAIYDRRKSGFLATKSEYGCG